MTPTVRKAAEQLLFSNEFDFKSPAPSDQTVFRMFFKTIGSLGDYILITGKKSSGKTKFVSGALSAAITGMPVFNFDIRLPSDKRGVVHFDTEQGRVSHFKTMSLIMQLSGVKDFPLNFKSYHCRSIPPHHIVAMVEVFLEKNINTGLVCLDGMLDVVESMNDEKYSAWMKRWLQEISERHNILFAGVIHRGFSADKSIGHLGSYLERGAQTVFVIEKKADPVRYVIRTEYIRDDSPPPETAIYFNEGAKQWELTDPITEADKTGSSTTKRQHRKPQDYDILDHSTNCGQIFNSQTLLSYKNLIKRICEVYGIGDTIARQIYKPYLLREGFIFDTGDGYTNDKQARLFIVSKTN